MATVVRRRDGRWAIVRRPLRRTMGRAFLVMAALIAVIFGVLVTREDSAFPWIMVVTLGVLGLLSLMAERPIVVDAEVKIIDLGRGFERGTSFLSVTLGSEVRTVRDQEVRLYTVALDRGGGEGPEASVSVTATPDERGAWQVSELLAKTLDLPVVDTSGGRPVRRTPAQLDQPLEERLVRADVAPTDPGPPPPGVDIEPARDRLRLSWQAPRARVTIAFAVLLAFIAISLWAAVFLENVALGVVLVGFGVTMLIVVLMNARGVGRNELEVDAHHVRHSTVFPFRRVDVITRRALEHVRDQSSPRPSVSLITDEQVLELVGSKAQCPWIRRKLEHWLAADATKRGRADRPRQ